MLVLEVQGGWNRMNTVLTLLTMRMSWGEQDMRHISKAALLYPLHNFLPNNIVWTTLKQEGL